MKQAKKVRDYPLTAAPGPGWKRGTTISKSVVLLLMVAGLFLLAVMLGETGISDTETIGPLRVTGLLLTIPATFLASLYVSIVVHGWATPERPAPVGAGGISADDDEQISQQRGDDAMTS